MPDTPPARSLVETVAAKYAEFLECTAARDLKAPLCMDDGMCSCRRDVAFIASAVLDAIAEPSEAVVDASATTLWESDKHKWVAPEFSQHEAYLRGISKEVWRAMFSVLRKEIENG